jgi:hypothetical protein
MKLKYFVLGVSLVLLGCSHDDTNSTLDTMGNETSASWHELRKITGFESDNKTKVVHAQPRYCYKTMQDVICYPTPIPGQEERLTGYQTEKGTTGYILPAHRHEADMEPGVPVTVSKLPVTNVPNLPKIAGGPATAASTTTSTTTTTTTTTAPVAGPLPKPRLKEVIFDPAELQPKTLVPDKEQ